MATLVTPFRKHLEFLKHNLDTIANDIVVQNADFIIGILVDRQIHEGINSRGLSLGTYSKNTQKYVDDPDTDPNYGGRKSGARFSKEMPKTGRYNLDWYGDYIEEIFLITQKGGFDIWSRDSKAQMLEDLYGKKGKILKLTKEHNDFINIEIIIPGLQKYLLHNLFRVGQQPETVEYVRDMMGSFDIT